jgi:hypothetical protein
VIFFFAHFLGLSALPRYRECACENFGRLGSLV